MSGKFGSCLTNKAEFDFAGVNPNDINGYALVLTIKLVSISSVGQRLFDLIQV